MGVLIFLALPGKQSSPKQGTTLPKAAHYLDKVAPNFGLQAFQVLFGLYLKAPDFSKLPWPETQRRRQLLACDQPLLSAGTQQELPSLGTQAER